MLLARPYLLATACTDGVGPQFPQNEAISLAMRKHEDIITLMLDIRIVVYAQSKHTSVHSKHFVHYQYLHF